MFAKRQMRRMATACALNFTHNEGDSIGKYSSVMQQMDPMLTLIQAENYTNLQLPRHMLCVLSV